MADRQLSEIGRAILLAIAEAKSFRAPDAVKRGRYVRPPGPSLPFAAVSPAAVTSTDGLILGMAQRVVVYDVQAWGQSPSMDSDEQVGAAEALLDEIVASIELARVTRGNPLRAIPRLDTKSLALVGGADLLHENEIGVFLSVELDFPRRIGLDGFDPPARVP